MALPKLPSDVKLLVDTEANQKVLGIDAQDVVIVINFDKFIHWLVDCILEKQKNQDSNDTWWKDGGIPPWEQ